MINYKNISSESDITFIVLGSKGYLGSEFAQRCQRISTIELLEVDPKLDCNKSDKKQSKFKAIEDLTMHYKKSLISKRRIKSKLIVINVSGISRSGKYQNDCQEIVNFNININIINDLIHLLELVISNNMFKEVLVVHFSTLALKYNNSPGSYELSKSTQESVLLNLVKVMKSDILRLIIFRISDVYGDRNFHKDKIINKLMHTAKNKSPLKYIDNRAVIRPVHENFIVEGAFNYISKFINNYHMPNIQLTHLDSRYVYRVKSTHNFALSTNRNLFYLKLLMWLSKVMALLRFYIAGLKIKLVSKNLLNLKYLRRSVDFAQHADKNDFYKYIIKEGRNS